MVSCDHKPIDYSNGEIVYKYQINPEKELQLYSKGGGNLNGISQTWVELDTTYVFRVRFLQPDYMYVEKDVHVPKRIFDKKNPGDAYQKCFGCIIQRKFKRQSCYVGLFFLVT